MTELHISLPKILPFNTTQNPGTWVHVRVSSYSIVNILSHRPTLNISFTYIQNDKGRRSKPRGTPHSTCFNSIFVAYSPS